jgi:hypothetical protein
MVHFKRQRNFLRCFFYTAIKVGYKIKVTKLSSPRRLLWIHQNFVTSKQVGNSRGIHLIAAMLELGWHVDLVTSELGYLEQGLDNQLGGLEKEGNLTIHRLPVDKNKSGYNNRAKSYFNFF